VRVASVLEQLLSNAIKFSAGGRIQLRSMLAHAGHDDVCVRFEVQDEGIGIAPDMQPHVFDAFRQVRDDAIARSDGLGIGLAIAKRAVDRLGGEIGVDSVPGAGSTFWFTARFLREPGVVDPEARERLFG
jgi:two-component system sensor histidine kinase/response regulator